MIHLLTVQGDPFSRLSYDSYRYLAGAESIRSAGRYLDPSGSAQQVWPPGTSLTYAAASAIAHRPPELLVRWIDLGAYLLACAALFAFLRRARVSPLLANLTLAAFVMNGALLGMESKLWSDPPALALLLTFLALALASLTSRTHRGTWAAWAVAVLACALTLRYAVVAAVPIACAVAFLAVRGAKGLLAAAAAAIVSLLPLMLAFHLLGVPLAHSSTRHFTFASIPLRDDVTAFSSLADQLLPVRLLGSFASAVVLLLFVLIPIIVALRAVHRAGGLRVLAETPLATGTLLAELWVIGYLMLLPLMQSVTYPSFSFDIRILLPLLPMLLAGTACAMPLLRARHRQERFAALAVIALGLCLTVAAARSAKFWISETGTHFRPPPATACVGGGALVDEIRGVAHLIPAQAHLVTTIQGPVWYALRRPVEILDAKDTTNVTRPDTIVLYVTTPHRCLGVPENDTVPLTTVRRSASRTVAVTPSLTLLASASPP